MNFSKILNSLTQDSLLAIVFLVPIYFALWQETYSLFILNKQVIFHVFLAIAWIIFLLKNIVHCSLNIDHYKFLFTILFFLGLSFLASTILSIHPEVSLWGNFARQEGLYSLINYFLFFILLILYIPQNKNFIKKIIITALLSSFFVCLYGLFQYLGFDFLAQAQPRIPFDRISSTLGQPNFLGAYLIIIIPLSIWSLFFIFKKLISRFLISLLILAQFACLFFSYSRSAWLGLLASLGIFIFLYFKTRRPRRSVAADPRGLGTWQFGTIFSLAILILFSLNSPSINHRLKSIFNLQVGSNKVRMLTWSAAIDEVKNMSWNRLLFGYGADTQKTIFNKYYNNEWAIYEKVNSSTDRAHNIILDTILQFGIIGLLLASLLYSYIILKALKYLKQCENRKQYFLIIALLSILAGYFINNLLSFSLVATSVYFYLILAILVVLTFEQKSKKTRKQATPSVIPAKAGIQDSMRLALAPYFRGDDREKFNIKFLKIIPCFLIFLFFCFIDAQAIRADYYFMQADKAKLANNCPAILANTEKAIELNPRQIFYQEGYLQNASLCLAKAKTKKEQRELAQKIINQISNISFKEKTLRTINEIARTYSYLSFYIPGFYNFAQNKYAQIAEINPNFSSIWSDLGQLHLHHKNYDQAIIAFEKALSTLPSLDHPQLLSNKHIEHKESVKKEFYVIYKHLGESYASKKEFAKAREFYQLALNMNLADYKLYKKIADTYYLEGDFNQAIWYNKKGLSRSPNDPAWPLALELLYQELDEK